MNDFNLMMAKNGIYTLNQENGKFVFFASYNVNTAKVTFVERMLT